VVKVVRTVNSAETISSQDYQRLREVTEGAIDHIKSVDPSIRPQLTLSTHSNFVDEIADQTQSGFGPDLLITDSDTALELYRRKLIDPIQVSPKDRADTPSYLFELVTAEDGQVVGRPVNQFVQLACFNKERIQAPPETLEDLEQESDTNNFGMALQLKDLFWSAEAFDAGDAMEAALSKRPPDPERQAKVTQWLHWLESASYQQNIRFLNSQASLRTALISGELDWISCWSSSLGELRAQMDNKLALAPLPKGTINEAQSRYQTSGVVARTQLQCKAAREGLGDDRFHHQTVGAKDLRPCRKKFAAGESESSKNRGFENSRRHGCAGDVCAGVHQRKGCKKPI
jgi:hypothetical protein